MQSNFDFKWHMYTYLAVLGEGKVNLVKREVTKFYKDNFRSFNWNFKIFDLYIQTTI